MRRISLRPCAALLGLAIWSGGVLAAGSDSALRCAAIEEDTARLSCYDAIFRVEHVAEQGGATAVSPESTAIAAPTPAAASTAAASPSDPTEDFGLTPFRKDSIAAADAKLTGVPPAAKETTAPDSMTAHVTTVAHRMTGELVVILDDGQVWVQIDTETKGRLKDGDEVTIRKGTLGSYLLVTPNHILVRVRRVK